MWCPLPEVAGPKHPPFLITGPGRLGLMTSRVQTLSTLPTPALHTHNTHNHRSISKPIHNSFEGGDSAISLVYAESHNYLYDQQSTAGFTHRQSYYYGQSILLYCH